MFARPGLFALTGAVTLDSNTITAAGSCGGGTGGGGGGQQCKDFTTGPSGNKAKFEFKAGFKDRETGDNTPRGEVTYIDDGFECSLRVRSTSVTACLEKGPHSRRIQGTAEISGHDGTYQLDVTDDDSTTDSFAIRLSNGYSASGTLKSGHIEIHKRCSNDQGGKDDDKDEDHKD